MNLIEKIQQLLRNPKARPVAYLDQTADNVQIRLADSSDDEEGVLMDVGTAVSLGLTALLPEKQRVLVEALCKALPASSVVTVDNPPLPPKRGVLLRERKAKLLSALKRGKMDTPRVKALLACSTKQARVVIDVLIRERRVVPGPYRGTYQLARSTGGLPCLLLQFYPEKRALSASATAAGLGWPPGLVSAICAGETNPSRVSPKPRPLGRQRWRKFSLRPLA